MLSSILSAHRGTPPSIVHRVDVIGISCYTSTDLINWKYEGEPCLMMPPAFPSVMIALPVLLTILSSLIVHTITLTARK